MNTISKISLQSQKYHHNHTDIIKITNVINPRTWKGRVSTPCAPSALVGVVAKAILRAMAVRLTLELRVTALHRAAL
jgi:hypothetical protein